jgi:hypothetical protein
MKPRLGNLLILTIAAAAPLARAAEPTYEELKQELKQLKERVASLEARNATTMADQQRVVDEMLKDAEARSHLISSAAELHAGYDKGFYIKSQGGTFTMRPGALMQFRNITNVRTGDDDETENGFELRRLRPRVDGTIFSREFTYSIVLDSNRNGGNVTLLDAWGQYQFNPTWAIRGGQFRNSWYHEGDVPDSNQLAVERSLIDALQAGSQTDRVQGIEAIYGAGKLPFRIAGAFHDGANSKNTDFQDTTSHFGVSGRAEYKLFGDWIDYKDFTAHLNKQNLFIVGAGFDWTQAAADVLRTTVDAQFETKSRWGLYGALNGQQRRADDDDDFDWGALAQAGYSFDPHWEPFVRYTLLVADDVGQDTYNEFAVGVNYYLGPDGQYGHRAKFTVDMLFLPEGAPADATGAGVLASDEAEFVLRAQFQLFL